MGTTVSLGLVWSPSSATCSASTSPSSRYRCCGPTCRTRWRAASGIFSLLDEKVDIVDKPDAKPIPEIKGRVEFNNVKGRLQGRRTGVEGHQLHGGAGANHRHRGGPPARARTTIINLIPRFYDVDGRCSNDRRPGRARCDAGQPCASKSALCCKTRSFSAPR